MCDVRKALTMPFSDAGPPPSRAIYLLHDINMLEIKYIRSTTLPLLCSATVCVCGCGVSGGSARLGPHA